MARHSKKAAEILLLGNATLDYFTLRMPARGAAEGEIWDYHKNWRTWIRPGGVHLAADMMLDLGVPVRVAGPGAAAGSPSPKIGSLAQVRFLDNAGKFLDRPDEKVALRLRISDFDGYCRLPDDSPVAELNPSYPEAAYPLLVLNDAGSALRDAQEFWRPALQAAARQGSPVVHKLHYPLLPGALRECLYSLTGVDRIVVVSADDLRRENVLITRCLSWERVVEDVLLALWRQDPVVTALLAGSSYLVVLFDVEAALVIRHGARKRSVVDLIFDPALAEGDVEKQQAGDLTGKMNSFLAHLVKEIVGQQSFTPAKIRHATRKALAGMRAFAEAAMVIESPAGKDRTGPGGDELAKEAAAADDDKVRIWRTIEEGMLVQPRMAVPCEAPELYRIVHDIPVPDDGKPRIAFPRTDPQGIAENVVKHGLKALSGVPSAQFGDFKTVDRNEIEGYRAIDRLLRNYLSNLKIAKPISLAVSGPPGAGKSFGVKQLVDENEVPIWEFNLSQARAEDLPGFFHEIRDFNLQNKPPLCFFDEFDTRNMELVASFLAPMQDGVFREGARVHPIGRGIFVFAGGTCPSFGHFVKRARDDDRLKLSDFLSRLSGFIDVRGPNPYVASANRPRRGTGDPDHVLRRAILLRSMLEWHMKGAIASHNGKLSIDDGVVNAFLRTERFEHGARSMEQIIRMCALGPDTNHLTVSDLPETAQLALHVDAAQFELLARSGGPSSLPAPVKRQASRAKKAVRARAKAGGRRRPTSPRSRG